MIRSELGALIDTQRRQDALSLAALAEHLRLPIHILRYTRRVRTKMNWPAAMTLSNYLDLPLEQVLALSQQAEGYVENDTYPLYTHAGVQYRPPITGAARCSECPYLEECRDDVLHRDGFAWCETLIQEDLLEEVQYA